MKYAVNHPDKFIVYSMNDEQMKNIGVNRRVFFAFLLGFA